MNNSILEQHIKRITTGYVEFNSILREFNILTPSFDYYDLFDIRMRFYSQISHGDPLTQQFLGGIRDFRLYINGIDYTKFMNDELLYLINSKNINDIKNQYKKAALMRMNYLAKFGGALTDFDKKVEINTLNQILSSNDFNKQISQPLTKGNEYGYMNSLFIKNYLYRDIDIDSISIKKLLDSKKNGDDFVNYDSINLTISEGPSPSFDLDQVDTKNFTNGGLYYSFEYIYLNPFYELLNLVLNSIKDTQTALSAQMVNYLDPIKDELDYLKTESTEKFNEYQKIINTLVTDVNQKF